MQIIVRLLDLVLSSSLSSSTTVAFLVFAAMISKRRMAWFCFEHPLTVNEVANQLSGMTIPVIKSNQVIEMVHKMATR
jgi:hypothetical protein